MVRGGDRGRALFGEPPSAAEQQTSARLLLWALVCGLPVPLGGLVLALATGRRAAAVLLAAALGLSAAGGVATGTLSRDDAAAVRDHLNRPGPPPERRLGGCQEHSGGGNRCPDG